MKFKSSFTSHFWTSKYMVRESRFSLMRRVAVLAFTASLLLSSFAAWPASNPYIYTEIEAPSNGATYPAPASIPIVASAITIDDAVYVTSIEIHQNGVKVAQASADRITYTATNLVPGTYTFRSKATNNLGKSATSTNSVVTVVPGGTMPPQVSLNQPTASLLIAPAIIGLSASASDPDGHITKVEYFANGSMVGTSTSTPYAVSWTASEPGTYVMVARATDNSQNATDSTSRQVVVDRSSIRGSIDGLVAGSDGIYRISGWACSSARTAPVDVHLYVGGAAGASGVAVGAYRADQASEPAVAAACSSSGATYRFAIPLPDSVREAHANKLIYVHGISPAGAPNALVANSGVFRVPAPVMIKRSYVYDQHHRLCKTIEPETGATVVEYDAAGNVAWSAAGLSLPDSNSCNRPEALQSGRVVARTYDARNRIKTLSFPDGNGDQVWTYTADGLPESISTTISGAQTTNQYAYNKRRMMTAESVSQAGWYSWGVGYGYDGIGNLSTQAYPDSSLVFYAPNALGQATQVKDHVGYVFASGAQYYPNGALKQFTYGNGLTHSMTQNARQLPARVTDSGNALDHDYGYDPVGNVSHIYDYIVGSPTAQHRYMQYDALDRLTAVGSAMFGGDHWHRFTYDALDNLKSWKLAGVKDHANYYYDASNRLTSIQNSAGASIVGLSYDAQGNLSNKNGQNYAFDYGNRLHEVSGKEYYRYDGHGRRVMAWEPNLGSILSQYTADGKLFYQEDYRGSAKRIYQLYLGSNLVAIREASTDAGLVTRYQHTDALGSPVAVTNEAGVVVERNNYEPFGAIIGKPNYGGVGFTGHMQDAATGLTYMQQRYYDPGVGRFLSVDPVTAYDSPIRMFNRYKYAANNPYRFLDPDGRQERERHKDWRSITARSPGAAAQMAISARKIGERTDQGRGSASIKYNAEPPRTVPPSGKNAQALQCTANCVGADKLLVTGGAEQSGHSRNSLHYVNKAVDIIGPPFNNVGHHEIMLCARACGYTHGGWEVNSRFYADWSVRGSIYKDHWHFQIGESGRVPPLPSIGLGVPIGVTKSPTSSGGMIGP